MSEQIAIPREVAERLLDAPVPQLMAEARSLRQQMRKLESELASKHDRTTREITELAKVAAETHFETRFDDSWFDELGEENDGSNRWRVTNEVRPGWERTVRMVLGALEAK